MRERLLFLLHKEFSLPKIWGVWGWPDNLAHRRDLDFCISICENFILWYFFESSACQSGMQLCFEGEFVEWKGNVLLDVVIYGWMYQVNCNCLLEIFADIHRWTVVNDKTGCIFYLGLVSTSLFMSGGKWCLKKGRWQSEEDVDAMEKLYSIVTFSQEEFNVKAQSNCPSLLKDITLR